MSDLDAKAWLAFACLAVVVALLLFVPAGTPRYWQAWAYLAVFFGPSAVGTRYLMKNDPALLRRRLRGGPTAEKETSQKIIMSFISIGYVALLVVSALDHRFGWSRPSALLTIAADLLILLGLYIVASGLSGKQLQLRDDRGRRRPARDFDRALRGRPPSDVCREAFFIFWPRRWRSAPGGDCWRSRESRRFSCGGCLTRSGFSRRSCRDTRIIVRSCDGG